MRKAIDLYTVNAGMVWHMNNITIKTVVFLRGKIYKIVPPLNPLCWPKQSKHIWGPDLASLVSLWPWKWALCLWTTPAVRDREWIGMPTLAHSRVFLPQHWLDNSLLWGLFWACGIFSMSLASTLLDVTSAPFPPWPVWQPKMSHGVWRTRLPQLRTTALYRWVLYVFRLEKLSGRWSPELFLLFFLSFRWWMQ